MFANAPVRVKLLIGFSVILVLLAGLAWFGQREIGEVGGLFTTYRAHARDTAEMGEVQAAMLMARIGVKDFILTGSETSAAEVRKWVDETERAITHAKTVTTSPGTLQSLSAMGEGIDTYGSQFAQVVSLQAKRNALFQDTVRVDGPQAERALAALMDGLRATGETDAVYATAQALRAFLLTRVHFALYLMDNAPSFHEMAKEDLAQALAALPDVSSPSLADHRDEAKAAMTRYGTAMDSMAKAIGDRNQIITGSLNVIGPDIAAKVQAIQDENKRIQDTVGPQASAVISRATITMTVVGVAGVLIGLVLSLVMGTLLANPIRRMTEIMGRIAGGDLDTAVAFGDRKDEIGAMSRAVEVFRQNGLDNRRLQADAKEAEAAAIETQRRATLDLADQVESKVKSLLTQMVRDIEHVHSAAREMASCAEETSTQSTAVAVATEQTTANVQTVATATEELGASSLEIGTQVQGASDVARQASDRARHTRTTVTSLEEAAARIGEIVSLINDIATQTNLLALNATIEAARAGDAGKGFAVVAGEVKSLANATTRATEDIRQQIEALTASVAGSASAVMEIGDIIDQITSNATAIAGAVNEQTAAINEVARNTTQASTATQEVASHIASVSSGAQQTRTSAREVETAADNLVTHSTQLEREVERFISEIRSKANGRTAA